MVGGGGSGQNASSMARDGECKGRDLADMWFIYCYCSSLVLQIKASLYKKIKKIEKLKKKTGGCFRYNKEAGTNE